MASQRKYYSRRKEEPFKINENIRSSTVRLIGDDIEQSICSLQEALEKAEQAELDLVEISPNANPPVCKIVDYSKFKYEQKKRQKELKSKTSKSVLKEIRFTPNINDHDFNFKLKHAINFLKEGNKVKAYVHFFGRTILYKDRGKVLIDKFIKELTEYGKVDGVPRLEGKRLIVHLSPISKKN